MTKTLGELAKTVRSKNAGVDKITFDIIFYDRATYEHVKQAKVLTRDSISALYGIPDFAHLRLRRVRPGVRDQVYDLPHRPQRQCRGSGYLWRATICPTAGDRGAGDVTPGRPLSSDAFPSCLRQQVSMGCPGLWCPIVDACLRRHDEDGWDAMAGGVDTGKTG